jgi:hypothetical protein
MNALRGKAHLAVLLLGLVAGLLPACDMGTVMNQRSQLSKPIPGDCIESALRSIERMDYQRTTEHLSESDVNHWAIAIEGKFSGGVNQSLQEDGTVLLKVDSLWMGTWPIERERLWERSQKDIMDQIRLKCESESNKFKYLGCDYRSFYSWEKRCPSKRQ